jgi:hypothetical protein
MKMKQHHTTPGRQRILWLAIATAFPVAVQAAPAAKVDFAIGNARIQGPGGATRAATRGAEVNQGETVDTGDGRVQLRFVDGAYVSLQPQSQFRIDEFRYNGQPDGTEKGFFSLIKGGLRTITGLVGRTNKSAYQVTTAVATIGIRGTEYTIQYGSSITGSVGEGEIAVCNAGGCLNVGSGEAYLVTSPDVKPQITDKKSDLPPPQPQNPPTNFAQGENKDASGDPLFGALLTGNVLVNNFIASSAGGGIRDKGTSFMVFDSNGDAREIDTCFDGCIAKWSGPVLDRGNDGVIAWGRWTGGSTTGEVYNLTNGQSLHYVAGLPATSADLAALRTARVTAEYQLLGGTTPTTPTGQAGTLIAASLSPDFGNSAVKVSVTVGIDGQVITGTGTGFIQSDGFFNSFGSPGSSSFAAVARGVTGSLSFDGFFSGDNARRAGLGYQLSGGGFTVTGAAGFTQVSTGTGGTVTAPPNP